MNPKTHQLEKGDIILVPGEGQRPHVVEYANFCRAYCLPLMTRQTEDGRVYDVMGPGVNIAPDSQVDVVQDSRKSANGSITDNLRNHPNYRAIVEHGSHINGTTNTSHKDTTTMQTTSIPATPSTSTRRRNLKMDNGTGTTIKVPVDASLPTQRTVMTREQRKAQTQVMTPTTPPTPKVGCPRGSDISHVGLSCDGSGKEVPPHRYFTPGMDARFKGWMLKLERGGMKLAELPETVRKSYAWEGVSGVDDTGTPNGELQGVVGTTNYKGEDNPRYIELMAEGRVLGPVDSLGRLKVAKTTAKEATETAQEGAQADAPAPKARRTRKAKE